MHCSGNLMFSANFLREWHACVHCVWKNRLHMHYMIT